MKKNSLPATLCAGCSIAGVVCMALRVWLLAGGFDSKGILITGHFADVVTWILTAVVLVLLVTAVGRAKLRCSFTEGIITDLQSAIQTVALVILAVQLFAGGKNLSAITAIAAILAALCCVAVPVLRNNRKAVPPMLRCPLAVFLLLFLIFRYQDWCREPALQLYCFELLAGVCLALAAYQRIALGMDAGSSRTYLITANAGVFFCLAAVPGAPNGIFYLLMAAAAVTDGCAVEDPREA